MEKGLETRRQDFAAQAYFKVVPSPKLWAEGWKQLLTDLAKKLAPYHTCVNDWAKICSSRLKPIPRDPAAIVVWLSEMTAEDRSAFVNLFIYNSCFPKQLPYMAALWSELDGNPLSIFLFGSGNPKQLLKPPSSVDHGVTLPPLAYFADIDKSWNNVIATLDEPEPMAWSAKAMMDKLHIVNEKLEAVLLDMEQCPEGFRDYRRKKLAEILIGWGAFGAQPSLIIRELEAANLVDRLGE